jgi:hypothetical protein
MNLKIEKYGRISNDSFSINGQMVLSRPAAVAGVDFPTFIYREFKVGYPKYFKMDHLSKLGFLMAELLLKDTGLYGDAPKQNMGIFISNNTASLDTDQEYQDTLGDAYFPSPSVFVYTLPNIVMGEIAIRHKIFGENTFFVNDSFDIQSVFDYVYQSFDQTKLENALVGWIEYYKGNYETFLMLVSKEKAGENAGLKFDTETITQLYKS